MLHTYLLGQFHCEFVCRKTMFMLHSAVMLTWNDCWLLDWSCSTCDHSDNLSVHQWPLHFQGNAPLIAQIIIFEYIHPPLQNIPHWTVVHLCGVASIICKYCRTKIYGHRCLSSYVDITPGIEDSYKYVIHLFNYKHICVLLFSKVGDRHYVALLKDMGLGPGKLERNYLWCCSWHLCSKTRHIIFYPYQQFDSL
jgi:hypothetical protein